MIAGFHFAALVAYAVAWAMHLSRFRRGRASPERRATLAAGAGFVLHLTGLVVFTAATRSLPLEGLGPASSTLGLAIAAFTLGAAIRAETRAAGLFLLPLVVGLLAQALLVGLHASPSQLALRGPWFVAHVTTVFIGLAGLALASAAALMYVLQFRALKRKEFGSVFRFFPSLDSLDRLERWGLGIGFPALSIGLLAGWGWTLTFSHPLPPGDPKVIVAVAAWGSYLAAILARLAPRWRGPRAAAVSVAAFAVTATFFLLFRLLGHRSPEAFL